MAEMKGRILVVDDDRDVLLAAQLFLKQHFNKVVTEEDPEEIPSLLKRDNYDLILLDMNFTKDMTSGKEGFYWLDNILQIDPTAIVILITAYGDVGMAVKAIKRGATDFILKPWQNEKLLATVSSAMNLRQSLLEVNRLRYRQRQLSADLDQHFHDMIGVCSAMKDVFTNIQKVAKTDANVLILGENGTGKELVARALHRQSLRSKEVFISVDMGAIAETLFESELFGYMKGAFTDAKEDKPGRFEVASGGTLFLDEISNLSLSLQSKLLRVLESRQVTRLGSNKLIDIDIRLICATNIPVRELIENKQLRQDLLYRINTVEIKLPPLRDRIEDIPFLAKHFTDIFSKKYKKSVIEINSEALTKLRKYSWPGNVRELHHAIERAIILSEGNILQPQDFSFSSIYEDGDTPAFDNYNLEYLEKSAIAEALDKSGGNITRAAAELGLTRTSLYRRMKKYGI